MSSVMDIITLFVLASLAVLIVMNASNFAKVVASVGNFSIAQTSVFTGSNYNKTAPTLSG